MTNSTDNRFEKLFDKHKIFFSKLNHLIIILGVTLLILILIEILSLTAISIKAQTSDPRVNSEVYDDKVWTLDYYSELSSSSVTEYYPYVGYRRVPLYKGDHINLEENSERKTHFSCKDDSGKFLRIFVFGGSTIWGTGSRDKGTIPSHLARELCSNNIAVSVTNFGESGYVSTQEIIKLQLELRRGNIPDIIIFYDGVNDVYSAYQNNITGWPENVINRQLEFNLRKKFNPIGPFPSSNKIISIIIRKIFPNKLVLPEISPYLANETANIYLQNIRIVTALEKEFGFKSIYYWQPSIYTKDLLSKEEEKIIGENPHFGESYIKTTEKVKKSQKVIDLSDIFDNYKDTIFIDDVHISEEGNLVIARRISENVLNHLEK